MLLIFNMELYKLSSKTGEMKTVKMSPGKAAAQSGHATLGAYRRAVRLCPNAVRDWLRIGQMKITVKCPTVSELLELERRCIAAGLNCCLKEKWEGGDERELLLFLISRYSGLASKGLRHERRSSIF
mmetsp:Transcript_24194/g.80402  ORF Transcript_24194/g.80402 Transcript_24194/m.80402 type:complete len:127 (+) Transcript_24194:282-662(+)